MVKIGKKILLLTIFLIILVATTSCNKQEELRLRILANSNSYVDQQNKEKVKNAVKEIYYEHKYIDVNLLENKLVDYISNDLYSTITIEIRDEIFPSKTYDGKIIPSGIYHSIVITLGEGKGNNFWTMLYPDFFNINFEENNEVEYHSYIYDKIIK